MAYHKGNPLEEEANPCTSNLPCSNLRRSARDYGIYFLTVAVTVALMESFLALACARDVLSLSENMGILTTGIVGVSVLVALLSSCVIAYGVGSCWGRENRSLPCIS